MSEPGPATADAALGAAVRPFRLAAFALAGPLAPLESLLGGADALPAALAPDLGTLDVIAVRACCLPNRDEAAPSPRGLRSRAVARRARRRADGRRRPPRAARVTRRPGSVDARRSAEAPAAGGDGRRRAADRACRRPRPRAGDAIAAGASLLGASRTPLMDAVVPPPGTARSGTERSLAHDRRLDRRADRTPPTTSRPRGVAESVLPGTGGAAVGPERRWRPAPRCSTTLGRGGARRDRRTEGRRSRPSGPRRRAGPRRRRAGVHLAAPRDTAAGGGSTVADLVLRGLAGTGAAADPPAGRRAGTDAARPARRGRDRRARAGRRRPTAHDERPAVRPRSEGETAVARALDRVQAATTAANVAATGRAGPAAPATSAPRLARAAAGRDGPSDLAWLVNEALVEQARRHGVDLS